MLVVQLEVQKPSGMQGNVSLPISLLFDFTPIGQ